ncbi:MAG: hypothetical protein ACR2J8_02470, partial [Thermomicrobiales bacterium]
METRRNQLFYVKPIGDLIEGVRTTSVLVPDGAELMAPPALACVGDAVVVAGPISRDGEQGLIWRRGDGSGAAAAIDAETELAGFDLAPPDSDCGFAGFQIARDGASIVAAAAFRDRENRVRPVICPLDLATLTAGEPIVPADPLPYAWRPSTPIGLRDGDPAGLTSFCPVTVLNLSAGEGRIERIARQPAPRLAQDLLGGSTLAPFGDGYLAVAREHANYPGGSPLDAPDDVLYPDGMHTLHRFVAFDRTFQISRLSHPFVFGSVGNESCGGLWISGETVRLSWAAGRHEVRVTSLPIPELERLLIPAGQLMFTGGHAGPSVPAAPRTVYCFWTGENEMPSQRLESLETIRQNAGCEVVLVTPDNLADFLVEPLHEAYDYLSCTHRADYLRAWFMHHRGGGYTD